VRQKTFILINSSISSLPRIVEPESDADRIADGQSDPTALEYDTTLVVASTSSAPAYGDIDSQAISNLDPKPSASSTIPEPSATSAHEPSATSAHVKNIFGKDGTKKIQFKF